MSDKTTPPPPPSMKRGAATLWKRYADELQSRQMLVDADLSALERLCTLEAICDDLTVKIAREGATSKDRDGTERRNPKLMALAQLGQMVESLKRSLAVGAYYRHRIGEKEEPKKKPKSVLLQYIARQRERSLELEQKNGTD